MRDLQNVRNTGALRPHDAAGALSTPMQDVTTLDAIAQRLAAAWRDGTQIPSALVDVRDERDARYVQRAVWRLLEPAAEAPGAWKVGAKDADAPVGNAPLPGVGLLSSGVELGAAGIGPRHFQMRGLELELALRLGSDIDAEVGAEVDAEVAAGVDADALASDRALHRCIDAVCSAIELVETRLSDWATASPLAKLADLQSHQALVLGRWVSAPAVLPDLRVMHARLELNGGVHTKTRGGNPAQDLLRLLRALATDAAAHGLPLRAGQVITTGACTGLVFAPPGATVRGQIDDLPPVALQFVS